MKCQFRGGFLLFLVVALLGPSNCLIQNLPGLYLDRLEVWSVHGSEHGPVSAGYNLTLTWRQVLPNVVKSALTLYNFQTGQNAILSYKTQLTFDNTTGIVNLNLIGSDVRLLYLSFSVIIITEDNVYLQLMTIEGSVPYSSSNGLEYFITPSKFNLSNVTPYANYFYEWVTGDMYYSSYYYNYWTYIYGSLNATSNQIKIRFWTSYNIYMTGFKVHILLVSKSNGANSTARHARYSDDGRHFTKIFEYNFGITYEAFGNQSSGYCLHGLQTIDMYVYKSSHSNDHSQFLFVYNDAEVSDLVYQTIWGCQVATVCYGQCPNAEFFNLTHCVTCQSAIPYCFDCYSVYLCHQCLPGGFVLTNYNSSCECPARMFVNTTSITCQNCPYDCLTCDMNGNCLTCNAVQDFRIFDNVTNRCVPMDGYYENLTTVSAQCPSQCSLCSSATTCSACSPRYSLNTSISFCDSCPYDCYTCDTSGNCLTCNLTHSFREMNTSNNRCEPIIGYFQNYSIVSGQCSTGCSICSSAIFCSGCFERYYYNSSGLKCQSCPHDCYTCDTNGSCLSCNGGTDYRVLDSTRCVPMVGYFESNVPVAGQCSSHCLQCPSASLCHTCSNTTYLQTFYCRSSCPSRYYQDQINRTCSACPYDCYTCDGQGNCQSCRYYDYRTFNSSTKRCDPRKGYYQTYANRADSCPSECTQCTSETVCSACEDDDYLLLGGSCEFHTDMSFLWIMLGVFLGGFGAFGLVALVVLLVIWCKKRNQNSEAEAEAQPEPEPPAQEQIIAPSPSRYNNIILRYNSVKIGSGAKSNFIRTNYWRDRQDYSPLYAHCSICLFPNTPFHTFCRHEFHIRCIGQWSDRNPICPNCRTRLAGKNHKIVCRQCRVKERVVTFDQLRKIKTNWRKQQETVCDGCREAKYAGEKDTSNQILFEI